MLMMEERITAGIQVADVFELYPQWDRGSRRLSGDVKDHVNPEPWEGSTSALGVNVSTCWLAGAVDAAFIKPVCDCRYNTNSR